VEALPEYKPALRDLYRRIVEQIGHRGDEVGSKYNGPS
jgi:hypothetical protein